MQATKTRAAARSGILYLRTDELQPNPVQPRTVFDEDSLAELAESIRSYGIRLREVPCVLMDVNMEDAGLIALIENLQRRDLDFLEEANGIRQLIRMFGMSQEEAARRLGKSQSAVANKLRILKLPEDLLETLRERGLSERHARALLRLPDDESRRAALGKIIEKDMTVAAAESYIDALLAQKDVMRDLRLFLNSVTRSLELMRQGGVAADMQKRETPEALILTISIPKGKGS